MFLSEKTAHPNVCWVWGIELKGKERMVNGEAEWTVARSERAALHIKEFELHPEDNGAHLRDVDKLALSADFHWEEDSCLSVEQGLEADLLQAIARTQDWKKKNSSVDQGVDVGRSKGNSFKKVDVVLSSGHRKNELWGNT